MKIDMSPSKIADIIVKLTVGSLVSWFILQHTPLRLLEQHLALGIGGAIIVITWILVSLLLKTAPMRKLLNLGRNFYQNFLKLFEKPSLDKRYTVEERNKEKYKEAIRKQIHSSKRIYFRLISAHTMFYEDKEKFIIGLLRGLSLDDIDKKKDIKIQLLDRSSPSFNQRAEAYVEYINRQDLPYKCSCDEYMKRCERIQDILMRIVGRENISFYRRRYLWRLFIFDNVIFVSTYSDDPLVEGHLSPAYSFNRECDVSLFDGFLAEFNSLYRAPLPTISA
jgi:hypothetical protein